MIKTLRNLKLARQYFNDDKFLNENYKKIAKAIEEDLGFENLIIEFEIYSKKKTLVNNHEKLSYQEIMSFEYDEDGYRDYEHKTYYVYEVIGGVFSGYLDEDGKCCLDMQLMTLEEAEKVKKEEEKNINFINGIDEIIIEEI